MGGGGKAIGVAAPCGLCDGLRQCGSAWRRGVFGPAEAGPFRFLTQRAARSRVGFEAPSQRREVGDPADAWPWTCKHICFHTVSVKIEEIWRNYITCQV